MNDDGPQQQESNPLNDKKKTHQIGQKNMIYVIGLSFPLLSHHVKNFKNPKHHFKPCLVTMLKTT
jgi:hypothetical protein